MKTSYSHVVQVFLKTNAGLAAWVVRIVFFPLVSVYFVATPMSHNTITDNVRWYHSGFNAIYSCFMSLSITLLIPVNHVMIIYYLHVNYYLIVYNGPIPCPKLFWPGCIIIIALIVCFFFHC